MKSHAAVAVRSFGDPKLVEAILNDYETADIDEKLRALLAFIRKLTLKPEDVSSEDMRALREYGLSSAAIQDAVYVCFIFCVMTRLADSLDWDIPSAEALAASAGSLLKRGYA
jgi:uncharacterized peroxidase-related enzyme